MTFRVEFTNLDGEFINHNCTTGINVPVCIYSHSYLWLSPFLACTLQIDDLEHKLMELHDSTAMSLEEASSAASEQISTLKLAPMCPTTHSHPQFLRYEEAVALFAGSVLRVYKITSVNNHTQLVKYMNVRMMYLMVKISKRMSTHTPSLSCNFV